jgi:hypothetical protein
MLPKITPMKLIPNNGPSSQEQALPPVLLNAPTTTPPPPPTTEVFKTSEPLEDNAVRVNDDMYADGVLLSCASNSICVTTAEIEKMGNLLCKQSYLERMVAKAACNEATNCIGLLKYISGNQTRYEVVTVGYGGNRCPHSNPLVTTKSLLYVTNI